MGRFIPYLGEVTMLFAAERRARATLAHSECSFGRETASVRRQFGWDLVEDVITNPRGFGKPFCPTWVNCVRVVMRC